MSCVHKILLSQCSNTENKTETWSVLVENIRLSAFLRTAGGNCDKRPCIAEGTFDVPTSDIAAES